MYTKFLKIFFGLSFLLLLPFAVQVLLLMRSGEMMPYADVARLQVNSGAVFGPAFNTDEYAYKLALIQERQSEVVVIGSSRVNSFRGDFFLKSFTNAAHVANNLQELDGFVRDLLKTHTPEVVLLGVDFWWFRYREKLSREYQASGNIGTELSETKLFGLVEHLRRGRVTLETCLRVLMQGRPSKKIGLFALTGRNYHLPDGCHFNPLVKDEKRPTDWGRRFIKNLEEGSDGRWDHATHTYDENFQLLEQTLARFRNAGVHVVVFVPPVLAVIRDGLVERPSEYGYVAETLNRLGSPVYGVVNFHDPAKLDLTDGEFFDDIHMGEIAAGKILLALAVRDAELQKRISTSVLRKITTQYAGKTFVPSVFWNTLQME